MDEIKPSQHQADVKHQEISMIRSFKEPELSEM